MFILTISPLNVYEEIRAFYRPRKDYITLGRARLIALYSALRDEGYQQLPQIQVGNIELCQLQD